MKDIGWKLLSVAIAATMWFMVINITQPVDTRTYSRPLTIENEEVLTARGLTIGNLEELKTMKVSVKVKAQRTALDRLSQNPEWIQATVDLSGLNYAVDGDAVALPVEVSMQGGVTGYGITSKSPAVVEARVETLASKEMQIEVALNGTLEEGVYLSEPVLSEETVTVSGPASQVERVTAVRAQVDAATIQDDPQVQAQLTAYDAEGNAVRGVSLSILEVTVSYTLEDMKQIPIQVDISGTPAAGYQVGEITCSPTYVEVTGSPEALADLVYLQMDTIDVEGRNASLSRMFSLAGYLPEGISLRDGSTTVVQVTVEITPQNGKVFTLDAASLTLLGEESDKTYTVGEAHVTINGSESILESLTANQLGGSIYVNGLEDGEHSVMIHLDLPEGLSAAPAYISVTVESAETPAEGEE